MTKMRFRTELRLPSKVQYGFFHIPDIHVEVDIPDEYVIGYPDCDIIYLTPDGLVYLERELIETIREEKEYAEEDIEEGW